VELYGYTLAALNEFAAVTQDLMNGSFWSFSAIPDPQSRDLLLLRDSRLMGFTAEISQISGVSGLSGFAKLFILVE
jgi:hypothetical protein